jgi:hypothetical protein
MAFNQRWTMNLALPVTDARIERLHQSIDRFGWKSYSLITATTAFIIPFTLAVLLLVITNKISTTSAVESQPTTFVSPTIDETLSMIRFSVIWAPLIETLLCQLLVIEVLKKFTTSGAILIAVSALIFGLGHIGRSGQSAAIATFVGLFLAFTYIHWLRKTSSKIKAYFAVALTHAIYNSYYVVLTYIPASVLF